MDNTSNNTPNNNSYIPIPPGVSQPPSVGPIVGVIIIVILLILAGFYFWGKVLIEKNRINEAYTEEEFKQQFGEQKLDESSASDASNLQEDISGMEAELDSEIENLEKDLENI